MSGTRIVIIVLVLVLVLFVVLVVWGQSNNGHNSQQHQDSRAFHPEDHGAISMLANFFGSPGPKLKANELTPNPGPVLRAHPNPPVAAGRFILNFGDRPNTFTITPDDKDQYRQGTFVVNQQECASMRYSTNDGSGGTLHEQCWPKDCKTGQTVDQKNLSKVTFQILSARSTLTISLNPGCTVQLE